MKILFKNICFLIFFAGYTSYAQKGLIYDPEKGIIFDDETRLNDKKTTATVPSEVTDTKKPVVKKSSSAEDLHVGRKKDPPEVYFKSGLEYFKNNDFKNAYKNFHFADSATDLPLYKLWKAKTLRKMGRSEEMLKELGVIINNFGNSDIADDALLELALHYKGENDYEKAFQAFTQIIEQYPFGLSSSTGEELPVLAREQRKLIRAEMINLLSILGIKKDDLSAGYKQFQKENDLPITGTGTKETVLLVKKMHAQFEQNEQKIIENERQLREYQVFTITAFVGVCTALLILIVLRFKVAGKRKHFIELKKALIELDLGKL